jgi:NitT/TauT family transport system permease protein
MTRTARWTAPFAVFVVALALWEWLVIRFDVPVWIVPAPSRIGVTLVKDWALLSSALGVTLRIALEALLAATALGIGIAFLFVQSRALEASLLPYVILLQVTPVVAIAPLIIIWVDDPEAALVICATIVALFPMISNTTTGLKSADPGLLDLFRLHRASRWQVLWRLRVPSALPHFFSGLKVSSGLALIGAVVAEFVAGTGGTASGLAYQILQAGMQLNFPRMFAALLLIALAGVIFFAVTSGIARHALRGWHASAADD